MSSERILIIDDEKNIRLVLASCLESVGYRVELAVDGEHGVERIAEREYDLVLLDLKLPGMDGMAVLERCRALQESLPVIMITAHGTIETAVESMKLGAVDYLQKPFTPDEITSVVDRVLARQNLPTGEPAETFDERVEQAKLLIQKRDFDRASEFLRAALTLNTLRPEPYNLLGCIAELRVNRSEAQRLYRAALSVDPTYKPADHNLSRLCEMYPSFVQPMDFGKPEKEQ